MRAAAKAAGVIPKSSAAFRILSPSDSNEAMADSRNMRACARMVVMKHAPSGRGNLPVSDVH
jgi:hypothetical protein